MEDDLAGDLEKDQGSLGGLCNVLVYVGREPWGSRGLRSPSRGRSVSTALVVTFVRGLSICTGLAGITAWTFLVSSAFNGWRVRAALENCKESGSVPGGGGGGRFIGELSEKVFYNVIFFIII